MQSHLEFNHECILLVPLLCFKAFKFSLHVRSKYHFVGITLHHNPYTEQECDCKHTEYNKTISWVSLYNGVINYINYVNIDYNLYLSVANSNYRNIDM